MEKATCRTYKLFTYDDIWEQTKEEFQLTDQELQKEVESLLQLQAWADIIVCNKKILCHKNIEERKNDND